MTSRDARSEAQDFEEINAQVASDLRQCSLLEQSKWFGLQAGSLAPRQTLTERVRAWLRRVLA